MRTTSILSIDVHYFTAGLRGWLSTVAAIVIAAIGLGHFGLGKQALAEDYPRYDPASCSTDAMGKVYIAIGHTVLTYPSRGHLMGGPLPSWISRLEPPDPQDPEGCPGNPEQLGGFAVPAPAPYRVGEPWGERLRTVVHPGVNSLSLVAVATFAKAPSDWLNRVTQLAEWLCAHATLREELPDGLTACRLRPTDRPDARVEDWAASYIAHPDLYSTPLGKPFAIHCASFLYTARVGDCEVLYHYSEEVLIHYQFQPYAYPGGTALAIGQVIDFDKALRAEIAATEFKGVVWPQQTQK